MGHFVTHHDCQAVLRLRIFEDARIHRDFAARQGKGIGDVFFNDTKLPLKIRAICHPGDASSDALDHSIGLAIGGQLLIFHNLLVSGNAHLVFCRGRKEDELLATGDGGGLTRK